MRRLEAHGEEFKLAPLYKINALRMLITGRAQEYFDFWEADHDPTNAAKTYEELLNKGKDFARQECKAEEVKPRDLPGTEAARLAALSDAGAEGGAHDLRPVGPWPAAGSVPVLNGRMPGAWGCVRCGKSAADTSCACELARKPCGVVQWQATSAAH